MPLPFHTVGHSDRTIDEFITVLTSAQIGLVVDVRRLPGSRRHPQFDEDALRESLDAAGIRFERIAELGGRRPVSKDVPFETNAFWQNRSFHNYADHALSDEFRSGVDELLGRGRELRTTVMCSEAVWWRCHRRIIADHLLARGETVFHLMGEGHVQPAEPTTGAVVDAGTVTYPA
ncbi:DUF488 domain-containing protein [Microbacterium aerolatum]|uniref:DUF488 domain-containing protein n=1 Tax=Microbacterium aerolatum TaxID=153731 RepID=UPI002000AB2F|nr:DUF488 domain-containing protein [Microbacterium aerolatum]MCK3768389.1 DUF488 domain-containing protein [Microbacterium aerolatum]